MATLVFSQSRPLALADAARLPPAARVDNKPAGAVVRVDVDDMDLDNLVRTTAALARLLPDASVALEGAGGPRGTRPPAAAAAGAAATIPTTAPAPPTSASGAPAPPTSASGAPAPPTGEPAEEGGGPAGAPDDPWELIRQRRFADALARLEGRSLDSLGRDWVRELLRSTDPEEVVLACDIARVTRWRSFVSTMRRKLDHADTRVRVAAVRAIGELSGPAMIWHLQKLAADPSPDVQAAVAAAIADIEGRQG